jgi:multidrug efflux pump subunit AcrA (membrane-fusion protein)
VADEKDQKAQEAKAQEAQEAKAQKAQEANVQEAQEAKAQEAAKAQERSAQEANAQEAAKAQERSAPARRTQAVSTARMTVEAAAQELAERMETAETTEDLSMPERGVVFTPGYPVTPPPARGVLRSDRQLVHLGGGRYKVDDVSTIADIGDEE